MGQVLSIKVKLCNILNNNLTMRHSFITNHTDSRKQFFSYLRIKSNFFSSFNGGIHLIRVKGFYSKKFVCGNIIFSKFCFLFVFSICRSIMSNCHLKIKMWFGGSNTSLRPLDEHIFPPLDKILNTSLNMNYMYRNNCTWSYKSVITLKNSETEFPRINDKIIMYVNV